MATIPPTASARLRLVGTPEAPISATEPTGPEVTGLLVGRALTGDVDAWTRLYQDNFNDLLRFVAYATGDVSGAEDLVQEAFAIALARLPSYDQRSPFGGWLRGIANNLVRKHWRKRARRDRAHARMKVTQPHREASQHERNAAPDAKVVRDRRADALRAALDTLPDHFREAFVLCDIQGLSAAEAAAIAGTSPGNLRVRATRARARLREYLAAHGLLEVDG